ncbi:MAG: NAD(P)H-dependent glycerol-3-phosphate dehydrogenase [Acidobacteriota bacterium]
MVGDGGWGTAVAMVLCDAGRDVTLWGYDPAYIERMSQTRVNEKFLPGIELPEALRLEADFARAVAGAELVVSAVPTVYLRATWSRCAPALPPDVPVVSLTKGIEHETLARPSEILHELLGTERLAVLSGPSHAEEVARRCPTTVVVSSADAALARMIQQTLITPNFRVYTSDDPVGVELGGALKNVIALAAGAVLGLELGDNAMAALLTRGLAEMTRLGVALGARERTFAGLSGLGDLVVTCTSRHGRNRRVGIELGRGRSLPEILAGMNQVAEGVNTARSARELAARAGVELPICEQVYRVLYEDADPRQAVIELMTREPKPEH